jgi:hypothetical protein
MDAKKIEEAFTNEGYVSIPFSFNAAGHPLIKATLANNVEANFLLDTGASINLLDYEFAKELNLSLTLTEGKGGGAGGLISEIYSLDNILLEIGGQHFKFDSFFSMDFSSMKEALIVTGVTEEIQGILGFGFFQMTKCFIDYAGSRIFVLNN